jgi:DNA-binding transcriptional regulator YdaS (Cro superfamily)
MARRHPDWLLLAVNTLGGASKAAEKIGVSEAAVANWLLNGTAKARHGDVV